MIEYISGVSSSQQNKEKISQHCMSPNA